MTRKCHPAPRRSVCADRKHRREGQRSVRIPLYETNCDVLIRMGLLKEDQRQDHKALRS
jgi:hypothetical protein